MRRFALVLLPLVCLALFVPSAQARRPPVVFVVFDEFPGDSLLDRPGHIDAERYAGFADLAHSGTWFPNAQSVYDATTRAVPAILDGRLPRRRFGSDARTHPNNLFTLFAGHRYRLRVEEASTRVCPTRLCGRRPPLGADWPTAKRATIFRRFVRSIGGRRPKLWFIHTLLPHVPWQFLPSGRRYRSLLGDYFGGFSSSLGFDDRFLTRQNEQRYLLQLGFVDRLLRQLLARLRRTGLYDKALVAVTADHGNSFDLGVPDRRSVTRRNIDEIAPVPFFIKKPHQHHARVERGLARTVDLLPTVAHLLHWRLPWRADGRNAFGAIVRRRREVRMVTRDFSAVIRIDARALLRRRAKNIKRRLRLFGSGSDSLYRFGTHPSLLGRSARPSGTSKVAVRLENPGVFGTVDLGNPVLPIRVIGEIVGGGSRATRELAVGANGVVAATGRSFHLRTRKPEFVSLVLPERSLRQGNNRIDLFEVRPGGLLLALPRQ